MAFSNREALLKSSFPVHTAGFVWLVGKILETDAFVAPIHLHFFFCNLVIRNTRTVSAYMAKSDTIDNQMKAN